MTGKIFLLILIFFLIGGAGVWRICVKKPGEKKRLLLKYFTYFFIVSGVCSLFAFTEEKTWLASFLVAAGTMEILFAWVHSGVKRNVILFLGIFIFGLVSVFFIRGIILLNSFFLLRLYVIVLSF